MNFDTEVFKLPCGYLDEDGILYTHVEVREMTGEQEDKIMNRQNIQSGKALDDLISDCCQLIQSVEEEAVGQKRKITPDMALNMRQGDRYACFIWIRKVSYGDKYKFQINCPDCKKRSDLEVNLSELDIKYMKEPTSTHYDIVLPKSGDTLTFKINTGHEEKKMEKMREQNPKDLASINLAVRLQSVSGKSVRPLVYLKPLTVKDRNFYRNEVEKVEGGVETRLKGFVCFSCENELLIDLPIQEDFFLPKSD